MQVVVGLVLSPDFSVHGLYEGQEGRVKEKEGLKGGSWGRRVKSGAAASGRGWEDE